MEVCTHTLAVVTVPQDVIKLTLDTWKVIRAVAKWDTGYVEPFTLDLRTSPSKIFRRASSAFSTITTDIPYNFYFYLHHLSKIYMMRNAFFNSTKYRSSTLKGSLSFILTLFLPQVKRSFASLPCNST